MNNKSIVTITRNKLYNLVWSKPISKIIAELAINCKIFKDRCNKHNIPIPVNCAIAKLNKGAF
jgi:hypothetical protein